MVTLNDNTQVRLTGGVVHLTQPFAAIDPESTYYPLIHVQAVTDATQTARESTGVTRVVHQLEPHLQSVWTTLSQEPEIVTTFEEVATHIGLLREAMVDTFRRSELIVETNPTANLYSIRQDLSPTIVKQQDGTILALITPEYRLEDVGQGVHVFQEAPAHSYQPFIVNHDIAHDLLIAGLMKKHTNALNARMRMVHDNLGSTPAKWGRDCFGDFLEDAITCMSEDITKCMGLTEVVEEKSQFKVPPRGFADFVFYDQYLKLHYEHEE